MTDLITSTFAQLCCFCFPCSKEERNRDEEESDAEALEKARQWLERMANAERGGKPPGYQAPIEMNQPGGQRQSKGPPQRLSRGDMAGERQGGGSEGRVMN